MLSVKSSTMILWRLSEFPLKPPCTELQVPVVQSLPPGSSHFS